MKINRILLLIITYMFFFTLSIYPQMSVEINNAIKAMYGSDFRIGAVESINPSYPFSNVGIGVPMNDTYGTLEGCYIFLASKDDIDDKDIGIFGIYKDNKIIWSSGPNIFVKFLVNAEIFAVDDLNNDGKIDIVTAWYMYMGEPHDMWIYSWDGINGTLITALKENGHSAIEFVDPFLLDRDGDGIIELCGNVGCYSWNGSLYGNWDEYPLPEVIPKDRLNAEVNCNVLKVPGGFKYEYVIKNNINSIQKIEQFGIDSEIDNIDISSIKAPSDWSLHPRKSNNFIRCVLSVENSPLEELDAFIRPSEEKGVYSFISSNLPKINNAYFQGYNYKEEFDIEKIKSNSFITKTLSPYDLPDTFIPQEFLDTLKSYNNQSLELGWIQNQETREEYNTYFNNAKNFLGQNNNSAAKSELQLVLNECIADSSTVLTSEAYALLYFNTEYLIEQIPDTEPGLPVKLQDSQGNLLQGGSLQYYDGSWKDAVNNGDGTFNVITERTTVSIRMTYEGGNQQFNNVPVGPDAVTFQTVNTTVQLLNSQNGLLDEGTVQYYAGSWRDFGTTVNGTVSKELLPRQYSFRMTYGGASNDKQQNIADDATVVFQTINSAVQLLDSQGNFLDIGTVQYYAGSWREFGTTTSGTVSKELLPKEYSFRMSYEGAGFDKKQNIGTDATVIFQTVNATVQLSDSQGTLIPETGSLQYYAGSWREFGTTSNGTVSKELLPKQYSFRMTHEGVNNDKQQDIGVEDTVSFSTVLCVVQVKDSQNQPVDGAEVKYYSGSWRDIGLTLNGEVTKELLPKNLSFRVIHNGVTQNKQQDIGANNTVEFVVE